MKNGRKFSGFTLAEVLIVVAITVVLAGVGFVSVFNHMRSLAQLERDTIAKEIFVAAQNHLTTAESQGYLNLDRGAYGAPGDFDAEDKSSQGDTVVYYLVIPNGLGNYQKAFDLMLPFGAVDETVRAGGSYIIRYQPAAARVLDVFYCARSGRFTLENGFQDGDYSKLMSDEYYGESKKSARRNYGDTKAVVGWYGGEASVEVGERLAGPTIEIINAERLQVKVTDPNKGASLQLIITGEKSQAKKAITILRDGMQNTDDRVSIDDDGNYLITLDDITSNSLHFCQLSKEQDSSQGQLVPGENISIQAIAFSNTKLTNVARSQEGKTNSLFGYDKTAEDHSIALISNIRHLENLDTEVSKFTGTGLNSSGNGSQGGESSDDSLQVNAKQTTDLVWPDFLQKIKEEGITSKPSVHYFISDGTSSTEPGTYKPVTPDYTLKYDGKNHSISEVEVNYAGDAGIFGALTGGSVSDLLILDSVISSSGNAGGLIGSMSGTTLERCAANGTVSSSGEDYAAGGLIGTATGGTVTACYSAGHTDGKNASYYTDGTVTYGTDGKPTNGIYNIEASGTAGGLIGVAESTVIESSYSTCSATGATVGGLIGSGSGAVTSCYATGLVKGTGDNPTEGAFAGSYTGSSISGSHYYMIINERKTEENGNTSFSYLEPLGAGTSSKGILALDRDAEEYEKFVGSDWADAVPNDESLVTYYQGTYPFPTVAQLGATVSEEDHFINTHYGDWPAPEIFVINQ